MHLGLRCRSCDSVKEVVAGSFVYISSPDLQSTYNEALFRIFLRMNKADRRRRMERSYEYQDVLP